MACSTTGSKSCAASIRPSQRIEVFGHAAIANALEPSRVYTRLPQILLQTQPWCRHLADRSKAHSGEVCEPKTGIRVFADDRKRIPADNFRKADEPRVGVLVMVLHDPHRPGPQHFDRAVEQRLLSQSDTWRGQKFYCQPFCTIGADCMRGENGV
jgi:hypothetical protein